MAYENLELRSEGHVRVLTLNHPPVNAWNLAMMSDFEAAVAELEADRGCRVVVITGGGQKCFSAGFDVRDAENARRTGLLGRALWTRLDRFEKPVVAAINGHALGGGLELALCCHFRLMAEDPDARLGLTELELGIIPGWGGTQRLARLVGRRRALEMILFSRRVDPCEALSIGLVDRLCPPGRLVEEALQMAGELARRPPLAVAAVLRALSAGDYEGLAAGLAAEERGSTQVAASRDREEGFRAFLEKRAPVFRGQ